MRYEIKLNVAGTIYTIHRHAKNPDRAVMLARIEVAKLTGHIPDPWAIKVSDFSVRKAVKQ